MINVDRCVLCGRNTRNGGVKNFNPDIYFFDCELCGPYHITFQAYFNVQTIAEDLKPFLRCATRQAFETSAGQNPLLLTTDNIDILPHEHENTSIPENLEKFLSYIRSKCPRPGQQTVIEGERDYTIIDAVDCAEFDFIASYAAEESLVGASGVNYGLRPKGWAYLMGPSGGGAIPGRCFVAMSFSVEPAMYVEGIRPAVIDCGYSPISMKDILMNEDICHRMLAEIRKAEIMVADFTENKHGVYFEAGFARARPRSVLDLPTRPYNLYAFRHQSLPAHHVGYICRAP